MLNLSLKLDQGDFKLDCTVGFKSHSAAILGPSGAGKSTVLKAIAGLVTPAEGSIILQDRVLFDRSKSIDLPIHARRVGYVFQDARLFPHLSVLENLRYGARRRGGASRNEVEEMAAFLGLGDALRRKPRSLSGGEAQRVAVGRALLSKPDILLLDEPLVGLDETRKADILDVLEGLKDRADVPMLYVSHDRDEVARLADEVAVLRAGRCLGVGPVAAMVQGDRPGRTSRFKARLVAKDATFGLSSLSISGGSLQVPQVSAPLGTEMSVEIAARDVMLARGKPDALSALNVLPAKIASIEGDDTGPRCVVVLTVGDDTLHAEITQRSRHLMELGIGDEVYAIIKAVAIGQPSGLITTVDA